MASADHMPVIKSALEGLAKRKGNGKGYFIHTSGTGILADFSPLGPGYATQKMYSDVSDIRAITSLPMTAVHRDLDDAVISGGLALGVPTAIISPPTIHGIGKGPLKKRSLQIPWLTEAILKRGKGFTVQKGENWWDCVHINDLADAYVLLTEEALKEGGGKAAWGADGYYFIENGEYVSSHALHQVPRSFC
jgi:nucleoside-diphosphate-sugar epimerase